MMRQKSLRCCDENINPPFDSALYVKHIAEVLCRLRYGPLSGPAQPPFTNTDWRSEYEID